MRAHSGGSVVIGDSIAAGRSLRTGLALWLVFAVVAVAIRGVRWDEAYEHAQILSGRVRYPADHPLFRYVHNGFSLQTYLAAAVVWIVPHPLVLCGVRNMCFVLTTAFPAYLFTAKLAGDPVWGHAAALLALTGIYTEFDSSYPITVWPTTFTNGYLGGGFMLVTLFLVLTHRLRPGLFLLGLAPAIHIGQVPAIAPVCGAYLAWHWLRGDRAAVRRALPWGLGGLALCIVFAGVMRLFHVSAPAAELATANDARAVWQGYTASADPHRKFPPGNAHVAAVAALILGAGAARAFGHERPLWNWLFVYAASVATIVWGVMTVHAITGRDVPFLVIGWMPYRLLNLLLPVLLAVVAGVLASTAERAAPMVLCVALLFGAILPGLRLLFGDGLVDRYFASGEFLLLLLVGAAYVILAKRLIRDGDFGRMWFAGTGAAFAILATYHHLGAAAFALGAILFLLLESRIGSILPMLPRRAILVSAALAAIALMADEFNRREHFPHSAFDRKIAKYLAERGEPDAMLLARPYEYLLQARTDHPVLVEAATASLMSYQPGLGPGIQQTYQDIYGIRFDRPRDESHPARDWNDIWTERTASEWTMLASKYGFDYVVAVAPANLNMTEALRGDGVVLYRARGDAGGGKS